MTRSDTNPPATSDRKITLPHARAPDQTMRGIALMLVAVLLLSIQDGISRHLAGANNTLMVVTIRYWFFAAFVIVLALRRPGGLRSCATRQPILHIVRSACLIGDICAMVKAFTLIGLVETHAVFAACPVMIALLAGPLLHERLDRWRIIAVIAGFVGVVVILRPGAEVFRLASLLPLLAAFLYALYSLLTRKAALRDPGFVSLFWSAIIGAVMITPLGLVNWQPMTPADWMWMLVYGLVVTLASWVVIRSYELAEASALQPFAYFQLVFAAMIGIAVFSETLRLNVLVGAAIVVAAGFITIVRARKPTFGSRNTA